MKVKPPKLDKRKASDLLKILNKMVPHYTPEWQSKEDDEKDPGQGLLNIFSYLQESVIKRLNQAPRQKFAAFLDMLGIQLLPAQPARAPLTFKLSTGADKEVLIPQRTQAAASKTDEHEELPFETEKNLLAIHSALKQVISIDPAKDAIYLPPPGFLEKEQRSESVLTYTIVSSPTAGTKNFQLDHVTDLEEEDFLKIGTGSTAEYVIISALSGNIVTITDKLENSFPAETIVQKPDWFSLYEGKNMQEHSIYLGHKELFDIKSAAKFFMHITHREGTDTGVTPLDLLWEYWGEVEGEEGEDWLPFETTDKTDGLSEDGVVELVKTVEGEIKETKINEQESRWIRCKVQEPLGVNEPWKLPVLDNIVFTVKSGEEDLVPDQAFNNETPLEVTAPFYPFGKEPRIFDAFSLGGKEIFSKKGAEVTIDVDLEPRGIVGPPVAVLYIRNIKVFAGGTYGRLMEMEIDPYGGKEPVWTDHGFPPATKLAAEAAPFALLVGDKSYISIFARADNGHLVERFYNGKQWLWFDHGTPADEIILKFDPAAVSLDGRISVFVVGSNGALYEFYRLVDSPVLGWIPHGKFNGISMDSSPWVDKYNGSSIITGPFDGGYQAYNLKVFLKGEDGNLYELDCQVDTDITTQWYDCEAPLPVKVHSRPFAEIYSDDTNPNDIKYYAKVFVTGSDGNLWERDTKNTENGWNDLGTPNDAPVDSAPHGYIINPSSEDINSEDKHIFVRDLNGCLWERRDKEPWINHQSPGYSKALFSPYVLPTNGNTKLHVFLSSNQNSIIERLINDNGIWNEYQDPDETALNPSLSWEYWNSKGWVLIKGLEDGTANLLESGEITFQLPKDIEEIEVAGQKNYWIRARIVGGDYGKETYSFAKKTTTTDDGQSEEEQKLVSSKDSISPPVVNSLKISYELKTETYPQKCLTYNNREYIDQTDAAKLKDKHFSPFIQLEEKARTLYLGFEKFFKSGPVKIYFDARELPFTEDKKPKMEWKQSKKKEWEEISSLDATEALIMAEILEFIGNIDFAADSRFGHYLFWLKGTLVEGEYDVSPILYGIYPNTTWAFQAKTIKNEILGSSDGKAEQTFSFFKYPVWKGEEIRVQEILTDEEKNNLTVEIGENAVTEVKDKTGNVTETWVLWQEVSYFYDSKEDERHYLIDRATGAISFGDGKNGMIPPAGDDNIKAFSYQAVSGGVGGNVAAGEIKTIKSPVAGVDKVSNPIAADGGADTVTLDEMLEIGPAMISHRDRAVTVEDFQWLTKMASRKIAKVRCYPNTNNKRQKEVGWVTIIIIPDSTEDKPVPTLELRRKVKKFLRTHCANTLATPQTLHIYVDGPIKDGELLYVDVNLSMDIYIDSIDVAARVDREVKKTLKAFLHPLTGGPEQEGWDFGRHVSASDIYAILEDIDGIDRVENLKFISEGEPIEKDILEIDADSLAANGTHTINLQVKKGE